MCCMCGKRCWENCTHHCDNIPNKEKTARVHHPAGRLRGPPFNRTLQLHNRARLPHRLTPVLCVGVRVFTVPPDVCHARNLKRAWHNQQTKTRRCSLVRPKLAIPDVITKPPTVPSQCPHSALTVPSQCPHSALMRILMRKYILYF